MPTEQDLIQKLIVSKKIMDKHNQISRGSTPNIPSTPVLEDYRPVQGTYNIPQELLSEDIIPKKNYSTETPTSDRILKSKLPDHIKQLMIEHPIEKPKMGVDTTGSISNEIVEKAARLMNVKANGDVITENKVRPQQQTSSSVDTNEIRSIVRETVESVLRENGLLTESTTNTNELFKFRVGEHIFEGKVLRIKKVTK